MENHKKTQEQLIEELANMRQRIIELEQSETERKQVEEMLRESELKYKTIVENTNDAIYIHDFEGNIIDINERACRMIGYDREELIGANLRIIDSRENIHYFPEHIQQLMKDNSILFEGSHLHKNGSLLPVEVSAKVVTREGNGVIQGFVRDITERKLAEEGLRERENLLSSIFRVAPIGIGVVKNRVLLAVNDRICEITGYTHEELIGKNARIFYPSDADFEYVGTEKYRQIGERGTGTVETRWQCKDGCIIDVLLSSTPINPVDMAGGVTFTALDITERKQADVALQESETLQRTLLENLPAGVIIIDPATRMIENVNNTAEAMFGTQAEHIVGHRCHAFLCPAEEGACPVCDRGKEVDNAEREMICADGSRRPVLKSVKRILIGGQERLLECFIDITKQKEATNALRESEERYRIAIEASHDGIAIVQNDVHVYVNQSFLNMFRYNASNEIIGRNNYCVIHSDDYERVVGYVQARQKGEYAPTRYEFRGTRRDGTPIDIEVSVNTISYKSEKAILAYLRDITERKLAEAALRESEAKYRNIFQNAVMGIFRTAPDGRYLSINPAGAKMYNYKSEEEMMQSVTDMAHQIYVHPEDRKRLHEQLNVSGFVKAFESPHYTKEGSIIWVSINVRVIRDNSGSILYYETTSQDITSRKQAEETIVKERDKLTTLSDNAPFGMVLIDQEGHFTYMNRKFSTLFGYDLSDIPDGRTWFRKAHPDTEYRHTVISTWLEEMRDAKPGEKKPNIITITCKDGTKKIVQFITSVLLSGDYLMTCEDITEIKKLENQLRQGQKMEAIGTLAGGIAHDFNNILTALMGYAALIQMKMDITDPLRPYVDEVLTASEKAVDLTQSLLAFSRQQSVTLVPLNMNNTIKEAKKLLRRLLTEDIEFHTALSHDDMIVMADKSQMDQILFNLVTNARDAMPKGGTLSIETALTTIDNTFIKVHGFGETGDYVRIRILDTGEGMDEMTRQKIFDPFFTTKEIGKGTGLGLATVYGIIKQHNGYIIVESAVGQGTTFHVYLPQVRTKVDKPEERTIPLTRGKETILIAEDNAGVRRFMREALQGQGYTIREAVDGEDAIEKFREHRDIDLIIIDSVMPKKNGRETYEEIHKIDPRIKALFTSGYTKDIVLDKGIEEKDFNFIAKPLSLNALFRKVREVLDR